MPYNRDGAQQSKKPRIGFSGKLVSLAIDNASILTEFAGEKVKDCYTYIDLAVVDETQHDENGKPTWHNIRLSAGKDNPIFLEKCAVLKKCDELLRAGTKPFIRGQYYLSTKVPLDETGNPLTKDGLVVVYKNKRMSLADLPTLEIVPEREAADAA